jgi:ribosomal protein L11 methyltransferase
MGLGATLDLHRELQDPADEQSPLPLLDAVAAVVDDFAPFAIDTPAPGRVRVYFTTETDRDAARAAVTAACGPRVQTSATSVTDQNWAARSQADLRSIQVGRVVIAPPWDLPTADIEVVVEIRPALGFGSGHHPTTRLALLGLQQVNLHGRDVLDLGTGSGVLAIAAVKLGARQATGIDRDPDALASAKESVAANHVASRVALRNADVAQLAEQPDTVAVIVANLTGAILISLAPVITTLVEPGGYIVLGGILAEEEAAVARAYRAGAHCAWRAVEDEWVGMIWKARPRQGQRIEPRWHSRIIEREGRSQKAEEDE